MVKRASTFELVRTKKNTRATKYDKAEVDKNIEMLLLFVVVVYPTPFKGWGHGRKPWSPRSQKTPPGSGPEVIETQRVAKE